MKTIQDFFKQVESSSADLSEIDPVGIIMRESLQKTLAAKLNEDVKGWKNAHSDLMKARSEKGKSVVLHSLNKDGSESGMATAKKSFKDEAEATEYHKRVRGLNPTRNVQHNLYIDGTLKSKLAEEFDEGDVEVLDEELKTHDVDAGNFHQAHDKLMDKLKTDGYKYKGFDNTVTSRKSYLKSPGGDHLSVSSHLLQNGVVRHTIKKGDMVNEESLNEYYAHGHVDDLDDIGRDAPTKFKVNYADFPTRENIAKQNPHLGADQVGAIHRHISDHGDDDMTGTKSTQSFRSSQISVDGKRMTAGSKTQGKAKHHSVEITANGGYHGSHVKEDVISEQSASSYEDLATVAREASKIAYKTKLGKDHRIASKAHDAAKDVAPDSTMRSHHNEEAWRHSNTAFGMTQRTFGESEEVLDEGVMAELAASVDKHLVKHVKSFQAGHMDADTLGDHCVKAAKNISKDTGHDEKMVQTIINKHIGSLIKEDEIVEDRGNHDMYDWNPVTSALRTGPKPTPAAAKPVKTSSFAVMHHDGKSWKVSKHDDITSAAKEFARKSKQPGKVKIVGGDGKVIHSNHEAVDVEFDTLIVESRAYSSDIIKTLKDAVHAPLSEMRYPPAGDPYWDLTPAERIKRDAAKISRESSEEARVWHKGLKLATDTKPKKVEEAARCSADCVAAAEQATSNAYLNGTASAHRDAMKAHKTASNKFSDEGDKRESKHHAEIALIHKRKMLSIGSTNP